MPLLVALDEYNSAITSIAIYAELALEDPASHEIALRLIQSRCHETDGIIESIISDAFPDLG